MRRHIDAYITEMPWLVEEAGDLERLEWVTEGETVLVGIFQQPDAFAGLVKPGMELDVFLTDYFGQFRRSEIHYGAQLVLAEAGRRAQDIDPIRLFLNPFLTGDCLRGVAPITGNDSRLEALGLHGRDHIHQWADSHTAKLGRVTQGHFVG